VSRIKMASGEITNGPLLLAAARTGKPLIVSTGMAMLGEIEAALAVIACGYVDAESQPEPDALSAAFRSEAGQKALRERVTLLHCTTEYPAPDEDLNLRAMDTLACAFGLPVGFSDHSEGLAIPIAAVARGAAVIEKHLTLDRTLPGPDHRASLEPLEFAELTRSLRRVEEALGRPLKIPAASEVKNMAIARKSLVAACSLKKGEIFTAENVAIKRPGQGMSPMRYWDVIGRAASRDYQADEALE
jgi:N-acetylneuraminate synthase